MRQSNFFQISPRLREKITASPSSFEFKYSDIQNHPITDLLADYHQTTSSNILIENGADGCLFTIFNHVRHLKGRLWLPENSYEGFAQFATSLGVSFHYYKRYQDLNKLHGNDFAVICHPHSPTGENQKDKFLEHLIGFRGHLVIDESYVDYNESLSLKELSYCNPKIFVVRSFSKAFGLPEIRLGYILSKNVQNRLSPFKIPFSNSLISLEMGRLMLKHLSAWQGEMDDFLAELDILQNTLRSFGVNFIESSTNFFFIKNEELAKLPFMIDFLKDKNIEFKKCNHGGSEGYRISFENSKAVVSLTSYLSNLKGLSENV
jgi:histidinol-phosphate/aromatic aminotransferase/cobyric acid decarboxylase-like protein